MHSLFLEHASISNFEPCILLVRLNFDSKERTWLLCTKEVIVLACLSLVLSMEQEQSDIEASASCCIAAAIENRAKEVGLAILDKSQMKLQLLQLIETSRSACLPVSLHFKTEILAILPGQIP